MDWKEFLKPNKKNITLTLLIIGISLYSLKFTYPVMSSFSLLGLFFITAPAMPVALLLASLGRETSYELLTNQILYIPSIIIFNYVFASLIISLFNKFKNKQ